MNRQQETLKQRQKTSTPEIESDSELEEEERASTDAAPTATSSTVRHETRSIAAANPFKKVARIFAIFSYIFLFVCLFYCLLICMLVNAILVVTQSNL